MSDERERIDDLRDRGAAIRDVASSLAVAWGRIERLSRAQSALLDAVSLLGAWSARGVDDPRFFDELTAVKVALEASLGALPSDRPDEAADLAEALVELEALREAGVSELVARKDQALRGVGGVAVPSHDTRFVASGGIPSVHDVAVPTASLLGTEAEDEDDDEDEDEDEDEDDEPEALALLGALGAKLPERRPRVALRELPRTGGSRAETTAEAAMLEALGRGGLEDLAGLSGLSDAPPDAPWAQREAFERRLGETLDALVALARPAHGGSPGWDLVRRAHVYATQWEVPDVGRTFALIFPLCCLREEAALDWVQLALARAHPRTHVAFVRALSLGVHPGIDELVRRLLETQTAEGVLSVALAVAARRRCAPLVSTLPLLAHPEPRIGAAAVEALVSSSGAAARDAVEEVVSDRVDATVAMAAARASARLGGTRGLDYVRMHVERWLERDPPLGREALGLLAAVGAPRDEPLVGGSLARVGRAARLVGHFGAANHVEPLLDHLRTTNDPEDREDTVLALHRITGLGFAAAAREDGAAPPEPAFARASSDLARSRLGADPMAWRGVWEAAAPALLATRERWRFGRPFRPRDVLLELADPDTEQRVRRTLLLEAEVALARPLGVDLDDWVARQRATLELLLATEREAR